MNRADQRKAYGEELLSLARENENIVALDADLSASTMSCFLEAEYPERFLKWVLPNKIWYQQLQDWHYAGRYHL